MDFLTVLAELYEFVRPRGLSDVFIDSEACLFLPILIYGYAKGWWVRLPFYMNRWLGLSE